MPTRVSFAGPFQKRLKHLIRKYPKVVDAVNTLISNFQNGDRPGDKIPNVGYDVYKVRLKNVSAGRGKSGGFRVVYYVQLVDSLYLLTIYSKTEESDISLEQIERIVEEIQSLDSEDDDG
jgi:mRNA-degrading endonuclease RelE of RelBE toxin-antitoxin system